MRVLVLISLIACFSIPNLKAQNSKAAQIDWGKELIEPANTELTKIIPFGTSYFYGLRKKEESGFDLSKEKIYLERYNEKMNLVKSKEVVLKYKKKHLDYEDFIKVGDQLYLLTSFNNQAKKKNYLFAQKVSKKNLTVSQNIIKIGEIDAKNIQKEGYFDHHISRDSSKVLIYNELPHSKGMPERFTLYVYDDEFNELWTKDISLPYDGKHFEVQKYQVDNDGNVFILGLNYKPDYFFTILEYSKDGEDFQEYPIKPTKKLITDLTFRVDDRGNLVCSGFYSDFQYDKIKAPIFSQLTLKPNQCSIKASKNLIMVFLRLAYQQNNWKKQTEEAILLKK